MDSHKAEKGAFSNKVNITNTKAKTKQIKKKRQNKLIKELILNMYRMIHSRMISKSKVTTGFD